MPRAGAVHGAHAALEAGATALGLRNGASVESRDNGAAERRGRGDRSDGTGVAHEKLVVMMSRGWSRVNWLWMLTWFPSI
jgi:hypothetical protein